MTLLDLKTLMSLSRVNREFNILSQDEYLWRQIFVRDFKKGEGLMSNACTQILVGVASLVSQIKLVSKTAKFPFRGMDYSPLSSKNLIDRNRLKKFMQIVIDVTFMHINFSGRGLFGFGDIATFKNGQISLSDHGL